jgi:hypothetical protein
MYHYRFSENTELSYRVPGRRWSGKGRKDAGIKELVGTAMNQEEWRKLMKEAKTLYEL